MTTLIDLEKLRVGAELREKRRDRREAAKARRRAEKDERRQRDRAERDTRKVSARVRRAYRRATLIVGLRTAVVAGRPVAPIAAVTAFAMFGQVGYAFDHLTSPAWPWVMRVVIAVGFAVTVESMANTVAWYGHTALLAGDTVAASRRRVAAYALALLVAGVNYAHFADGWAPTPGAVVFALFSAVQPWLWGMHTRRTHHLQLKDEGRVDDTGTVFSSARWRAFPYRTWLARRYSIAHGITDPRQAWEGSEAERIARRDARVARRTAVAAARRTEVQEARTAPAPARRTESVPGSRAERRGFAARLFRSGRTDEAPAEGTRTESAPSARTEEPRTEPLPRTDPVPGARTGEAPAPRTGAARTRLTQDRSSSSRRRLTVVDDEQRLEMVRGMADELGEIPTVPEIRKRTGWNYNVAKRVHERLEQEPEQAPEPGPRREAVTVG